MKKIIIDFYRIFMLILGVSMVTVGVALLITMLI